MPPDRASGATASRNQVARLSALTASAHRETRAVGTAPAQFAACIGVEKRRPASPAAARRSRVGRQHGVGALHQNLARRPLESLDALRDRRWVTTQPTGRGVEGALLDERERVCSWSSWNADHKLPLSVVRNISCANTGAHTYGRGMTPRFTLLPALLGLGTGLALIVAIGAQNAYVLRLGIAGRRGSSRWSSRSAPCPMRCSSRPECLGIGAVIEAAPVALVVIRILGSGFLIVYGLMAARRVFRPQALEPAAGSRARSR